MRCGLCHLLPSSVQNSAENDSGDSIKRLHPETNTSQSLSMCGPGIIQNSIKFLQSYNLCLYIVF